MNPRALFTVKQRAAFQTLCMRVLVTDQSYEYDGKAQVRRARTMALGKLATLARKLHMASLNRG